MSSCARFLASSDSHSLNLVLCCVFYDAQQHLLAAALVFCVLLTKLMISCWSSTLLQYGNLAKHLEEARANIHVKLLTPRAALVMDNIRRTPRESFLREGVLPLLHLNHYPYASRGFILGSSRGLGP